MACSTFIITVVLCLPFTKEIMFSEDISQGLNSFYEGYTVSRKVVQK